MTIRKLHYSDDGENPICNQTQSGLAGVDLSENYALINCKKCFRILQNEWGNRRNKK